MPSSRRSSWLRDWACIFSCIVGGFFTTATPGNPKIGKDISKDKFLPKMIWDWLKLKCLYQRIQSVQFSSVAQSCPTLCDPMNCSPPGSSVHGIFLGGNTGVGCLFFLQRVFSTQGLNPHLLGLLKTLAGGFFEWGCLKSITHKHSFYLHRLIFFLFFFLKYIASLGFPWWASG